MELDFRKLNATKLFDFSKEQEQLIFKMYDNYSEYMIFQSLLLKNLLFIFSIPVRKILYSVRKYVIS